jgi:hypothetical protein
MNTKNITQESVSTTTTVILVAGALSSSVAAAWLVSSFGPGACTQLNFSAALDRIPLVLNLAIFAATILATNAFCQRLGAPEAQMLSFTWLLSWWPIGAGCVGALLLFLQLPEHVWSSFTECAADAGHSEVAIQAVVASGHVVGWFLTLLLAAWHSSWAKRPAI